MGKKAECRMGETFGATGSSLFDALEANNAQLDKVRGGIMDELRRLEAQSDSPKSIPVRSALPRGVTAATFGLDDVPGLDFEKLLAECDAMQAETNRWLHHGSPKAPRRLEKFEQQILPNL